MKIVKPSYTILLLILLFNFSVVQSQSIKKALKSADAAMEDKDYPTAVSYYATVMKTDSITIEYQMKYADALRQNYEGDDALRWYKKIYFLDKGKDYPLAPFYIGMQLRTNGKYKDAKKYFDKFIKANSKKTKDQLKPYLEKAKHEMEGMQYSEELMDNPKDIVVVHLDTMVNSKVSEYAAFEYDSTLYFSSLRNKKTKDKQGNGFNKLYTARQQAIEENKFLKAVEVDSLLNKDGIHNANTSFSSDYTKLLVSRCEAKKGNRYTCEIYISEFKDGHWTSLEPLPSPINIKGTNNTQPCFSKIGEKQVLFFGSDRSGGEGEMDIWYSYINNDGTFEDPINAGKNVNTPEDDITPWYVSDTSLLYFSSTYHKGLGNFDIFYSKFKDGQFGPATNMGYPINSSFNDIYYSLNSYKNRAYISSNRTGSLFEHKPGCCNDIWSFPVPKKPERVVTPIEKMMKLCPLTLYFHNDEPDKKTMATSTKLNYMKTYDDYLALVPKYEKEWSAGLNAGKADTALTQVENFFEDSVKAGVKDLIKFTTLLDSVLKQGAKVSIIIKGFCSPLATTEYNTNLAKRRIVSLQNYFREYNNGVFIPYIDKTAANGGSITYTDIQIGEILTSESSDDFFGTRESIYRPLTARERKIQIVSVGYLSTQ